MKRKDINPDLRVTHGKKGVPPLTAYVDRSTHIRFNTLVIFDDSFRVLAFACQVSDADTRDN